MLNATEYALNLITMKIVFSVLLFLFIIEGVFGVDPDGVKTVIEGDSVPLQTDFIEMQKDGLIEWTFNGSWIATIDKVTGNVKYNYDKLMLMFSDKLDLDQNGFLTIWNIRIKHSGEYKVKGISRTGTKSKMFNIIVEESPLKSVEDKDEIKVLSATKGSSETLHTETELQEHDLILWRFGAEGSLIAKGDTEDNHTSYYDGDDGRFRGRLEMDRKTGSLTITDLESEQTGEFRLKIISDRRVVFKRFTVTVSVPGLSPGAVAGICIVMLLVAAAVVAVVVYFQSDHYKAKKLMSKISKQLEKMMKISKQLEQMTKTSDKELAQFSEKLKQLNEDDVSENEKSKISAQLQQMSKGFKDELLNLTERLKKMDAQNIPERLFEFSEQVKQINDVETSEQETRDDVTPEETPSSEIREGERKRFILVEETAISKAIRADKILRDRQGRKSIAIREKDDEVQTHDFTDDVMISEQETCADVTQKETPRPELKEREGERSICVQETPISKVLGDDKRLRDGQGRKSLVIRKINPEDAGVQTHGSDGKAPGNELKELKEAEISDKKESPEINEKELGKTSAKLNKMCTAISLATRRTHGESFKLNEGKNVGDDVTPAATPTSKIREGADDTQEKTPRPEIREGESEHLISVQETPISKVLGDDERLIDRQGRKTLVIRKTNPEAAGVQTHGSERKSSWK